MYTYTTKGQQLHLCMYVYAQTHVGIVTGVKETTSAWQETMSRRRATANSYATLAKIMLSS